MNNPYQNLALLAAAIDPVANAGKTLERIDLLLDQVDALIKSLPIENSKQYSQQVYDLYAALELAVDKR